jgi:hypothetical protein
VFSYRNQPHGYRLYQSRLVLFEYHSPLGMQSTAQLHHATLVVALEMPINENKVSRACGAATGMSRGLAAQVV